MQGFTWEDNQNQNLKKIWVKMYSSYSTSIPLQGSGRNVTMNNYFTGVPLAKTMLQGKLTIVETMKKCKREILQ